LLGELGIRDAHLRALDGKPTSLLEIRIKFSFLIGPVDSFDIISRLKKEPALRDQLRSIVLTLLQAQVVFCWICPFLEQYIFTLRMHWLIVNVCVSFGVFSQFDLTYNAWGKVPLLLRPTAIDAFQCNRSAMQGVSKSTIAIDPFLELSACKAFRVLANGNLAPASSALLLLLRRGDAFSPATLDECIIEELEEEIEPRLHAAPWA
jgi:hypothetical protein